MKKSVYVFVNDSNLICKKNIKSKKESTESPVIKQYVLVESMKILL